MGWLDELRRLVAAPQADPRTPQMDPMQSHGGWPGRAAIESFNAIQGMGEAAKNMATTDKRYTQQELEDLAHGTTMTMAGSSYPTAGLRTGSAGIFGGRLAYNAPDSARAINAAKNALARGQDPGAAAWKHRWEFAHPDQLPRFEIDDSPSNWNPKALQDVIDAYTSGRVYSGRMGDVYEHPDLYKNYPQIADMSFVSGLPGQGMPYQGGPNTLGYHVPASQAHPGGFGVNMHNLIQNQGRARKTMLHELQHRVQDIEGFAGGGSPTTIAKEAPDVVRRSFLEMADQDVRTKGGVGPDTEKLMKLYNQYMKDPNIKSQVDFNLYRRLAGEAEARNVATRADMTGAHRAAFRPWQTMGETADDPVRWDDMILRPQDRTKVRRAP